MRRPTKYSVCRPSRPQTTVAAMDIRHRHLHHQHYPSPYHHPLHLRQVHLQLVQQVLARGAPVGLLVRRGRVFILILLQATAVAVGPTVTAEVDLGLQTQGHRLISPLHILILIRMPIILTLIIQVILYLCEGRSL